MMRKFLFLTIGVLSYGCGGGDSTDLRQEGEACAQTSDCRRDLACVEGTCGTLVVNNTADAGSDTTDDTTEDVAPDDSADMQPDENTSCRADEFSDPNEVCRPCSEARGTQRQQTLEIDGDVRTYLVHIPENVSCDTAAPLWVHFHGTAGATPEEAYQLQPTIDAANQTGAILVRPRSRSSVEGGAEVFRWDQNPGDIERNMAFTRALVAHLETQFLIDDSVRVASGFSSGSNMTAVFLTEPDSPFTRLAPLAGGLWSRPLTAMTQAAGVEAVLLSSGVRDYLYGPGAAMVEPLRDLEIDAVLLPSLSGHEFHEWEIEAIADRLLTTDATLPTLPASHVTHALQFESGTVVTAMSDGTIQRTTGNDTVQFAAPRPDLPYVDGCVTETGGAIFTTLSTLVRIDETLAGPVLVQPWPEAANSIYGVPYEMGLACAGDEVLVVGYWGAAYSDDGGRSWASLSIQNSNFAAQVADAIHTGTDWVSYGYYNVNRGDPVNGMPSLVHPPLGWYNGASVADDGSVLLVGNKGILLDIEGTTTTASTGPDDDLYDVVDCENTRYFAGRKGLYRQDAVDFTRIHDGLVARALCTENGIRAFGSTAIGEIPAL